MPSDSGVQIIAGGDTLQDNEKIAQLLTQLMQTGQAEQAANIRQLCGYVDSLEKQYALRSSFPRPRRKSVRSGSRCPMPFRRRKRR